MTPKAKTFFQTLHKIDAKLKQLATLNDFRDLNKKEKIKITDILANIEPLIKFYLDQKKNDKNCFDIEGKEVDLNNLELSIVALNEILYHGASSKDIKEKSFLKKNFLRLNNINCEKKVDDLKIYKEAPEMFEETEIENVYSVNKKIQRSDKEYILQNFSSCIPVELFEIEKNKVILDACASPGNKTHQIACKLQGEGKIIALEKDITRFNTLKKRIRELGVKDDQVELRNEDFLNCKEKVDYILLDPSCSGSGTKFNGNLSEDQIKKNLKFFTKFRKMGKVGKVPNFDIKFSINTQEIEKYAENQKKMLEHAISMKPKKICYSTCSIFEEENEKIVEYFLKKYQNLSLDKISLKSGKGLEYDFSDKVVRIEPKNGRHGFFVAVFILK